MRQLCTGIVRRAAVSYWENNTLRGGKQHSFGAAGSCPVPPQASKDVCVARGRGKGGLRHLHCLVLSCG
eukprot:366402-Chlamydomonas_euryale.AAC.8